MNLALRLNNISVAYKRHSDHSTSLKESMLKLFKKGLPVETEYLYALKNLTLEVPVGTTLGIVGSNGSGKSTLLKVISQVLIPSGGSVEVNGSIASLIELGIGFDPELNAVENIYLHGSLYKRSKAEMDSRIEHIIDFAELNEFRQQPLKHYSSGMAARLGFAAAIDINPDILVVDEVLAVGDERFQKKCKQVFEDYKKSGKTLVIVSHNLEMIRHHCQTVALISCGQLVFKGSPDEALNLYHSGSYHTRLHS